MIYILSLITVHKILADVATSILPNMYHTPYQALCNPLQDLLHILLRLFKLPNKYTSITLRFGMLKFIELSRKW